MTWCKYNVYIKNIFHDYVWFVNISLYTQQSLSSFFLIWKKNKKKCGNFTFFHYSFMQLRSFPARVCIPRTSKWTNICIIVSLICRVNDDGIVIYRSDIKYKSNLTWEIEKIKNKSWAESEVKIMVCWWLIVRSETNS